MDRGPAHRPVLPDEVLDLLTPVGAGLIVDCTVGAGGHAELMLSAAGPDANLIGIDLDEGNLRIARDTLAQFGSRVRLFQANFSQVADVLDQADQGLADVLLADLGVSSMHLDQGNRGFSFQTDGPLDMRMDSSAGQTAADIVNATAENQLADLIYQYGEERFSRRIAKAIVAARKVKPIERTCELAQIVAAAMPAAAKRTRRGVHPATRTFQAIRIAVNDELGSLEKLLSLLGEVLCDGGRAGIISFHSLEDRRVKQAMAKMAAAGQAELLTRKPISPGPAEQAVNPRSRSAKLRGIRWIEANKCARGAR